MQNFKKILLMIAVCGFTVQTLAQSRSTNLKTATFGMGCFWCTEAVFQRLKGVSSVESGYSGGKLKNPTYDQISTGRTGHAEVLRFRYDPMIISYAQLLEIFWKMHDPTTLNRQGNDIGPQYRSVIFYHDAQQKAEAERYKAALNREKAFPKPIVTQIVQAQPFYKAEENHQNYYNLNKNQPYCRVVITPKIEKLEKVFKSRLKQE